MEDLEPLGGLFTPVPDEGLIQPAYVWGPKEEGKKATVRVGTFLWQCPVSAIPGAVWDLLDLWWELRLLRLQPERWTPLLRVAFLVFESELKRADPGHSAPEAAAALAVGAMVKLMGGGGR